MLYALDLARGNPARGPAKVEEVFQGVCENFELPEGARAFAKELVTGVTAQGPALDAEIARHAQRWRISRMAAVDRNVLRLGAFELLYTDAPAAARCGRPRPSGRCASAAHAARSRRPARALGP